MNEAIVHSDAIEWLQTDWEKHPDKMNHYLPVEFGSLRKQCLAIGSPVLKRGQLQRTAYLDIHHRRGHQFHEPDLPMDSI